MTSPIIKPTLCLCFTMFILVIAGCTEEKALALQSGAIQYRDHAVRALSLVASGIQSATAMPNRTFEQLTDKLKTQTNPINAESLEFLLTSDAELALAPKEATKPLEEFS